MSFGIDVRNSVGIGLSGTLSIASKTALVPVDNTAPSLVSATIDESGNYLTLVFDENVRLGAGGGGGFAITASGGSANLVYVSGGVQ